MKCLESVLSSSNDVEILVVDNNSGDGTVEMIKSNRLPVRLIENSCNLGFGKAVNQAARLAKADILFLLNPDTVVSEETLISVEKFLGENPVIGIGGCYVYSPQGDSQNCHFKFPTLLSILAKSLSLFRLIPVKRFAPNSPSNKPSDNTCDPDSVSGSAMAVRRSVFEQVGGFDEAYFLFYEETDLCYRIKKSGWRIAAIPQTHVVHYHQQSARSDFALSVFHNYKSEFLFFQKYYPKYQLPLLRLLQFMGVFLRTAYWLIVVIVGRGKNEARAKLRGYLSVLLANYRYDRSLLNI